VCLLSARGCTGFLVGLMDDFTRVKMAS